MRCEKCGHERENGNYYQFRYGNMTSRHQSAEHPGFVQKNYVLVGTREVWICRLCYIMGMLRSWFGIGTLFIAFAMISLFDFSKGTGGFGMTLLAIGMIIAFLCIPLFFHMEKYKKNAWTVFGDMQAMRAYKKEYEAKGYNVLMTRSSK